MGTIIFGRRGFGPCRRRTPEDAPAISMPRAMIIFHASQGRRERRDILMPPTKPSTASRAPCARHFAPGATRRLRKRPERPRDKRREETLTSAPKRDARRHLHAYTRLADDDAACAPRQLRRLAGAPPRRAARQAQVAQAFKMGAIRKVRRADALPHGQCHTAAG